MYKPEARVAAPRPGREAKDHEARLYGFRDLAHWQEVYKEFCVPPVEDEDPDEELPELQEASDDDLERELFGDTESEDSEDED